MPVLALVRSPSVEHRCDLRPRHGERRARPHLGGLRPRPGCRRAVLERGSHRADPRQRSDGGRRLGRDLQLDDADVLPRLRHLGRLEHDRQHQLPQPAQHQDRSAPPGSAAVVSRPFRHLLQRWSDREPARGIGREDPARHRRGYRVPRRPGRRCERTSAGGCSHTFSDIHPEPTEEQIRAGVDAISQFEPEAILAVGGGSVLDAAKAMRLFHEVPS